MNNKRVNHTYTDISLTHPWVNCDDEEFLDSMYDYMTSNVVEDDECHLWKGPHWVDEDEEGLRKEVGMLESENDGSTYGAFLWTDDQGKPRATNAHIVMWELISGMPRPNGMVIRHSCDRPGCVNPLHLEVGTQADNMREMFERGRAKPWGRELKND